MFKFAAIVLMAVIACVAAKPGVVAPLAYTAPFAGSAVVSQEYHGNFAAPYVAASPYVAAASPYVASPYVASPYVASPYVAAPYAAAPYAAYAAASPYVAAPYTAPLLLKK
ncbi:uncharacterized protein LOC135953125 [Calliphora vicina]|uniref:uncharacterized protein LOC135953125 n=1 Tax=Calliphora vicina TaxID=7373 RepID=UPI00325B0720